MTDAWLKLKVRLLDLKYGGLKDTPCPYDRKPIDWYTNLSEADTRIEEIDAEFQKADKLESIDWGSIHGLTEEAEKAKERLEEFLG